MSSAMMIPALWSVATVPPAQSSPRSSLSGVEQWVASLPVDEELLEAVSEEPTAAQEHVVPVRKMGVSFPTMASGKQGSTAADIFHLAQAARRARERLGRQSLTSNKGGEGRERTISTSGDRATMLRTAYAAQRLDRMNHHPLSDGTFSISFDSSLDPVGLDGEGMDEEAGKDPAEQILISLGFGGPPSGLERVPERFLRPSLMKGVELDQLFAQQQEEEEAATSAMGYRGLAGPPERRPSGLIARLYERMGVSRKGSAGQPSNTASVDLLDEISLQILEDSSEEEEEEEDAGPAEMKTPTNVLPVNPLDVPLDPSSRRSSLASSRKSSLKRQERFDDPDVPVYTIGLPSAGYMSGPAVYVTDAETASSSSLLVHPKEVDPIFAVLQLAAEAYRVQLDNARPLAGERDWNHNGPAIEDLERARQELRKELDRTDVLLSQLRNRLSIEEPGGRDLSSLRSILDDMTALLQHQRDLYRRVSSWERPAALEVVEAPVVDVPSSTTATPSSLAGSDDQSPAESSRDWMERFERRLTARIRSVVRRELHRHSRHPPHRSKTTIKKFI